jgi:acetyl-CoA carboxylase carboxyltransferase component
MGAEGACNVIFRKEIANSKNKEEKKAQLVEEFRKKFSNPYVAASKGYIDNVIEPKETREKIISALKSIYRKREEIPKRKHGNIPV